MANYKVSLTGYETALVKRRYDVNAATAQEACDKAMKYEDSLKRETHQLRVVSWVCEEASAYEQESEQFFVQEV